MSEITFLFFSFSSFLEGKGGCWSLPIGQKKKILPHILPSLFSDTQEEVEALLKEALNVV